jgi:hypothetical protein
MYPVWDVFEVPQSTSGWNSSRLGRGWVNFFKRYGTVNFLYVLSILVFTI